MIGRIIINPRELELKVFKAFLDEINHNIKSNYNKIVSAVKSIVFNAIRECKECNSLRNDKLKFDFGLNFDPVDKIAQTISESVECKFVPFRMSGQNISGELSISIQPSDFSELFDLKEAKVITEKDQELEWLKWLLTRGDAIIITGFRVNYKAGGRSGGAVMVEKGFFKVDSNFAGTDNDNFITRALLPKSEDLLDVIESSV